MCFFFGYGARLPSAIPVAVALALLKSAGHDGPLLYPGPLCGGESGTTGRAAGVDRDVDSFSLGQESDRKARPRLTDLLGRKPNKRQAGCSFSLVTFSLSTQRESDSPSAGGRKLLLLRSRRTRRKSALTPPLSPARRWNSQCRAKNSRNAATVRSMPSSSISRCVTRRSVGR